MLRQVDQLHALLPRGLGDALQLLVELALGLGVALGSAFCPQFS